MSQSSSHSASILKCHRSRSHPKRSLSSNSSKPILLRVSEPKQRRQTPHRETHIRTCSSIDFSTSKLNVYRSQSFARRLQLNQMAWASKDKSPCPTRMTIHSLRTSLRSRSIPRRQSAKQQEKTPNKCQQMPYQAPFKPKR